MLPRKHALALALAGYVGLQPNLLRWKHLETFLLDYPRDRLLFFIGRDIPLGLLNPIAAVKR